ncbi:nuclear protein 96-domain-containing protein [Talaromyces proteolyticus]|uniref:Nuclear protein 96-domain-containing protein n=1 Tax=Talaromyces proteolyticus TaxID=1131652 RepID=A0AAD4KRI6_9EURO|nr:nuclear protein 96-domain-containing protein [Talaromyces proteolyticus]KAH8697654.1 nuclear protein 96-domain-containing protein [Talaromyces proteolyticus]
MQPYQRYSFEELRLADYQSGRRYANASGQAGAFGSSAFGTGFNTQNTGFGSGGGFGATTSAPSGFGGQAQTQTAGGFGSSTTPSTSLFGAAKPANSLFGSTANNTTQSTLFGGNTATSGTFGQTANTSGGFGTGGSLFGNNQQTQQQQQNKSLFGGNTTGTGFGGGGFGSTSATTASNPFGGTSTASGFGSQQQTGAGTGAGTGTSAFGGFGAQTQNQNQAKPGGLFSGGLATGNQPQQTSTGLFGNTNPGSSLFGLNNQPQQGTTSLFGNQNQQSTGTGLFGGTQQQEQKPGGLFGSQNTGTATNTGSTFGGFGGAQNTQTGGTTSLFGNNQAQQQQQQKPGGLFGGSGGGSLFGQTNTAQNTGSLFGGQSQQQPSTGFGTGSMFSSSQQNQQQPAQQQPAPGSFQASLLDGNPYGNQSIFSGLPVPNAPSPGPLATPLSASMKQKQRTPLPIYKITPNAANRLITPPRRQGYGFSYSTYGSPSSASSVSSLTGSLLGNGSVRGGNVNGSLGRSFGKSFSTSNLRKSFDPDADSVLTPGALTGSTSRYSSGSLKRLTIDRSLRNDLFQRPTSSTPPITNGDQGSQSTDKHKKRVSFSAPADGAVVRTETEISEPTAEEIGFLKSIRKSETPNGASSSAAQKTSTRPEMEQVRGNELAVVPEHAGLTANGALSSAPTVDPKPGEYWMKPSRAELSKMSREQLKHVEGFTVGRQGCGQVTFDRPVDLNTVDLDSLFGIIVQIGVRSITVYPDDRSKPPLGKGLNVPSTLRIENSWPRGRDQKSPSSPTTGPLLEKHIQRLRRITNTEFVRYEKDTGIWVFRVPHFTTYGLDYDDDEEGESFNQSTLSAGPDTPTPKARSPAARGSTENTFNSEMNSTFSLDESFVGSVAGVEDDTFDFKKRKMVPGAFGDQMFQAEEEGANSGEEDGEGSFLEDGSTGSVVERDAEDDITESIGSVTGSIEDEDMVMAGTFPIPHQTVEHEDTTRTGFSINDFGSDSLRLGTPSKPRLDLSGDWAQQLQRTISPRKQDRETLRVRQAEAYVDKNQQIDGIQHPKEAMASPSKGFTSSIDMMQSLFSQPNKNIKSPGKKQKEQLKAFELPHSKTPKTFASSSNELSANDDAFHHTHKPRWGPRDSLVTINEDSGNLPSVSNGFWSTGVSLDGVRVFSFRETPKSIDILEAQRRQSSIRLIDGIPFARNDKSDIQSFIQSSTGSSSQARHERFIWQLTSILFNDDIEDDISAGVPPQLRKKFLHRIKKDRLSRVWENLVREKYGQDLDSIEIPEERAFAFLTFHRIEDACNALVESGNLHLATMLAQIGRDKTSRIDMQKQVESWRQHNVYSEINEPIRALYELLAGNTHRSVGRPSGAPEDRASTFTFSERFELDWIQAFGLRLWYGIAEDEPIEAAVSLFLHDLATGEEPAYPIPAHFEAEYGNVRHSSLSSNQESPLWVLLKVYAAAVGGPAVAELKINLPEAVLPEAVSGNKLTSRLSFQLHQVVTSLVGMNDHIILNKSRADQLTWSYAWELIASGAMEPALFVLLHLSRATDREHGLKETLGQFAATLPRPTMADGKADAGWTYLVDDLKIPESWVWVAKALFSRYSGDYANEVGYLIRAKNWNEAHTTFCRIVGPRTVIERDWNILRQLLNGFGDSPERKVRGWSGGGAVYEDFLRLVTAQSHREQGVLKRLIGSLVIMGDKIKKTPGAEVLEERVAFMEMSRIVAGWCAREDDGVDLSAVLKLPLTGDARVMHTAEISRRYYSMVMASAN